MNVILDFFRHLIETVHIEDFLADFVLIILDVRVRVNLLRPQIFHHLDRPLAKNVFLENVGQTGLRVNGKDQNFFALRREPVRGGGGERRFAQTAFAAEHDVAAIGIC